MLIAGGPLEEPVFVRFEQQSDGVQVTGTMTAWDAEGFDGSFGRHLWIELVPRDTWRLYVAVMDQNDPNQWIDLGRVLLLSQEGDDWAERAFRRGVALDESVQAAVDDARAAAVAARQRREQHAQAIEEHRLGTSTPEAATWPADRWPELTPDQRVQALAELESDAARILRQAGLQLVPLETDHYVLYADLVPLDTARLARRLEDVYEHLADLLWLEHGGNRFWGKAVVFYFADGDRFRLVEAESFEQLVPRSLTGITHFDGPKVFINLTGDVADDAFYPSVVHETVHAFMHRYRSPKRLPPWANEGVAEYVADRVVPNDLTAARRARALAWLRQGGDVSAIFTATYEQGWPGPDAIGPALGALLVELMVHQQKGAFGAWIRAVKGGTDWRRALADDYGVPLPTLLDTFVQYYRVND